MEISPKLSRWIWMLAHRAATSSAPAEDLYSEGCLGALRAWSCYQPGRVEPETYLFARARGAISHYKRDRSRLIAISAWRQELPGGLEGLPVVCSLEALPPNSPELRESGSSVMEQVGTSLTSQALWSAVATLSDKERFALDLYYVEGLSDRAIGERWPGGARKADVARYYRQSALCRLRRHRALCRVLGEEPEA